MIGSDRCDFATSALLIFARDGTGTVRLFCRRRKIT
jgi:hypothetical protein